MIFLRLFTGLFLCLFLLQTGPVFAAESTDAQCVTAVYDAIAHEERLYRSVLYGQKQSGELPSGAVRYDKEFDTWMKIGNNAWQSPQNEGLTWSDVLMDEQADVPARRGLFEVRKTPSSDLLPHLTQAMRALQCRMQSVCERAGGSVMRKEGGSFTVQPEGCISFTVTTIPGCIGQPSLAQSYVGTCDSAVITTLEREAKLLQLAVAYDSAYRTLLQFAGTFEGFMNDFRFPLLQPLWQTARMLGTFDHLPCFSAQCDE